MSDEQPPNQGGLVPSGTRGLSARSASLVRRGLDSLLAEQKQEQEDPTLMVLRYISKGGVADEQGHYAEAEQLFLAALKLAENFRPGSPFLNMSRESLARTYCHQGKYAEAELLSQEALAIDEEILGAEHQAVAGDLEALGWTYARQERYAEAERLFRRALPIYEKVYGPEDLVIVAPALGVLGWICTMQGKYAEAEGFYRRELVVHEKVLHALAVDERVRGVNKMEQQLRGMNTAQTLSALAWACAKQGKDTEAEGFYQRALAIHEKVMRPEYPEEMVATALDDYAALLRKMQRHTKATQMEARAKTIRATPSPSEKIKRWNAALREAANKRRKDELV